VGAIFGIGRGIGLAFIVDAFTPLPAAVAPWSIAVGVGVGIGRRHGRRHLSRAPRRPRLDPIAALRQET
jgi:putative ABC transport system permease protein